MKAESTLHLRSCFLPFNFISSPLRAPLPLLHPPLDLPPAYPPHTENKAAQYQVPGWLRGGTRGLQWERQKSRRGQRHPAEMGGLRSIPRVGVLCEGIVIGMVHVFMCVCECVNMQCRGLRSLSCMLAVHTHARDQWGLSLYRWVPPVGVGWER